MGFIGCVVSIFFHSREIECISFVLFSAVYCAAEIACSKTVDDIQITILVEYL
jgi:hypothetical protein